MVLPLGGRRIATTMAVLRPATATATAHSKPRCRAICMGSNAAAAAAAAHCIAGVPQGGRHYAAAAGAGAGKGMLEGMLVLELANVLAGPSVCQFMAELGAEVIKVENSSTRGDVTRTWKLAAESEPTASGAPDLGGVTAYFSCCNLGKKSMALDIREPEALSIVHQLAAKADVVVASYKPGDAEKLGVDEHTLRSLNPRLIYAQITGYGLDDPRAGYDAVIQAESGFQYMNGPPGGSAASGVTKMPVALMDLLAAHQLKEALLVGLWNRERNGGHVGETVTVSLIQAGVSALANQATGYLRAGAIAQRMGSDHPSVVPYGTVFEAADGKLLTLAVGADRQFRNLCTVLGASELGVDERFATNPQRVRNRDQLIPLLRELIADPSVSGTRDELMSSLRDQAVPVGGVNDMEAVFEQPPAEALVVREPSSGEALGLKQVAYQRKNGPESAGYQGQQRLRSPPRYAEHTVDILSGLLGMEDAEIATLLASGSVVQVDY